MKTFFAPAQRNAVAVCRPSPLDPDGIVQHVLPQTNILWGSLTTSDQRNLSIQTENSIKISQLRHFVKFNKQYRIACVLSSIVGTPEGLLSSLIDTNPAYLPQRP
jgi:hypothetical protein